MKKIKFITTAFFISVSLAAVAAPADSIIFDRSVVIQKDFNPVIQDAGKINATPSVQTLSGVKKSPANYSTFVIPADAEYEITALPWANLSPAKKTSFRNGYARIGAGFNYNFSSLLDFAYPLIKEPADGLDFVLNHYGIFGKKMYHTSKAALSYDHLFRTSQLSFGGNYRLQGFNYYGDLEHSDSDFTHLDPALDRYFHLSPAIVHTANAFIEWKSRPTLQNFKHGTKFSYDYFNSKDGLTEHVADVKFGLEGAIDKHRIGIDLGFKSVIFPQTDNYHILMINPYYRYVNGRWNVRAGGKASFSLGKAFGKGMGTTIESAKVFNPSFDIAALIEIVKKKFYIYAELTGDYTVNNMHKILEENRYIFPLTDVKPTYTPFDFIAGLKIKPANGLLFDVYLNYQNSRNQYFFVNKLFSLVSEESQSLIFYTTNQFDVEYYNSNLLSAGLNISYDLNEVFDVLFKAKYNHWTVKDNAGNPQTAWCKPAYELSLHMHAKPVKSLLLSLGTYAGIERFAMQADGSSKKLSHIIDLNFGANYVFTSWLSVFLKLDNLTNSKYEIFNGYQVNGINGMVGAIFSF